MTRNLALYDRFQRLMAGARKLTGDGQEGSHAEVFRFDAEAVVEHLGTGPEGRSPSEHDRDERLAAWLSDRFLVKKGKIEFFAQPLFGSQPTRIRRSMVSWAFGPQGINVLPTIEKTLVDATEAARVIPYLGYGSLEGFFAPDLLDALEHGLDADAPAPNADATLVRTLLGGVEQKESAYRILERDLFFHNALPDAAALAEFQRGVRRNPLTASMEQRFAEFFENPITVGVRDVLRWARGSRHPRMPWETAHSLLRQAFDRWGHESFVLPEITYYTYDTDLTSADIAALFERNRIVARALASQLEDRIPAGAREAFQRLGPERLAFELLDFHTDYKRYDVEPYNGFLSASSARMAGRLGAAVALEVAGLPVPGQGNLDLAKIPPFQTSLLAWLAEVPRPTRCPLLAVLGQALARFKRRGLKLPDGTPGRFERIPRTFYSFQQRADVPSPGGTVRRMLTGRDLWKPENADLWLRHPEISGKLAVFFTLAYRYFEDTGFAIDLRPRDSGRDIFIFGLWGAVTENLMIVEEEVGGEEQVRVDFVDNRDQFKDFRGDEDRRHPLGMAKYALRLIYPIIEPALVRSVGVFVEDLRRQEEGEVNRAPKDIPSAMEQGLDVARKVAKDAVDQTFVSAKAAVDDLIDDAHTGARETLRKVKKEL